MRACPDCGGEMVLWGHGRMERWRCPACHRIRRKGYHAKVEITPGAPQQDAPDSDVFIESDDVILYHGDCLEILRSLSDTSVDCVVTSPPYWGLRDYGADGQLGLEETPDQYVANMVAVFREVKRVLSDTGVCWLNLGDSFMSAPYWPWGLKTKDQAGIPHRVYFALQADGWYGRMDNVWGKLNPMPESVSDRPTKSHEYIFLLTKSANYFFDQEAVREPHESTRWGGPVITQPPTTKYAEATAEGFAGAAEALSRPGREWNAYPEGGRNIRSVWNIATAPYPGAHFATFPEALVRRCIMAGCPAGGTVLDPFIGSGTVAKVARDHGRKAIGIDLNEQYLELAARRVLKQSKITLPDDLKPAPDGTLNLFDQK